MDLKKREGRSVHGASHFSRHRCRSVGRIERRAREGGKGDQGEGETPRHHRRRRRTLLRPHNRLTYKLAVGFVSCRPPFPQRKWDARNPHDNYLAQHRAVCRGVAPSISRDARWYTSSSSATSCCSKHSTLRRFPAKWRLIDKGPLLSDYPLSLGGGCISKIRKRNSNSNGSDICIPLVVQIVTLSWFLCVHVGSFSK